MRRATGIVTGVRPRGWRAATATLALLITAAFGAAQQRIIGGYALDANQRVGSGGFNTLSTVGLHAPRYDIGRRPATSSRIRNPRLMRNTVQIDGQQYDPIATRGGVVLDSAGHRLLAPQRRYTQAGDLVTRLDPRTGAVRTITFYGARYDPLR
jgi:hypothetical protein